MSHTRRRAGPGNDALSNHRPPRPDKQMSSPAAPDSVAGTTIAGALVDLSFMLSLVFGGCCTYVVSDNHLDASSSPRRVYSNVWSYEQLLRMEPRVGVFSKMLSMLSQPEPISYGIPAGSALTFSQMLFITLQQLPSFTERNPSSWFSLRLKPRAVPLSQWLLQVVVLASGSLLNNWVFAFNVPLTIQIVFRSAGKGTPTL